MFVLLLNVSVFHRTGTRWFLLLVTAVEICAYQDPRYDLLRCQLFEMNELVKKQPTERVQRQGSLRVRKRKQYSEEIFK